MSGRTVFWGAPAGQLTSTEVGSFRITRKPRYPPMVNFIGIALPASAVLRNGWFLTGRKKPVNFIAPAIVRDTVFEPPEYFGLLEVNWVESETVPAALN